MTDLSELSPADLAEKVRLWMRRIVQADEGLAALDELVRRLEAAEKNGVVLRSNAAGFKSRMDQAEASRATYKAALDAADWYIRCLENVWNRRPAPGLEEAQSGYRIAARETLSQEQR